MPLPPLFTESGGETVNAASIMKGLATSQPILKLISLISSSQGRFCGGAKKQALPAPRCKTFNGSEGAKIIRQPWGIFFCFREANSKPADLLLSQGGLMKNLEGVARISSKNASAAAFQRYIDHCERYIWIGIKQALKSLEIAELLKYFEPKLFRLAHFILNTPSMFTILLGIANYCIMVQRKENKFSKSVGIFGLFLAVFKLEAVEFLYF